MNPIAALWAYRAAFWAVILGLCFGSMFLFYAGSLKVHEQQIALERRDLAIVQKLCGENDKQWAFEDRKLQQMRAVDQTYSRYFTNKQLEWILARDHIYERWMVEIKALRKEKCEADTLILIRSVL